jgi:hypothetical protein
MAIQYVRSTEADDDVVRGLNQLAALCNELKADHNALLTKLDADAGVTDTNYAALRTVSAADADTYYLGY